MSRGRVRTRLFATTAAVTALVAYSLVVAAPASAAPTCSVTGGVVNITSDVAGTLQIQVRNTAGQIFVDLGGGFDAAFTCPGTPSVALLSTTTAINVQTDGGNQQLNLWLSDNQADPRRVNWGTINFTLNLGTDTAAPRDRLYLYNAATLESQALDLVMGANGIDLNDDGDVDVTVAGIENFAVESDSLGEDSISAAGSDATGAAFTLPILGVDGAAGGPPGITASDAVNPASTFPYNWLEGGAGDDDILGDVGYDDITGGAGNDRMDCGAGGGTADFYDATAAVTVNLPGNIASGHGVDTVLNCADVQGSPQGDTITGRDGEDNWIAPGAGDDTVSGGGTAGFFDTVSYWDAEAAVTVDLAVSAAQDTGGSGSDTLSGIENAEGSDFDDSLKGTGGSNFLYGDAGNDTLLGRGGNDELEGSNGVDTVDYSWVTSTRPVSVGLSCTAATAGDGDVTGETIDDLYTIENAILTANDDSFLGNQFQNKVWPNGGQNTLSGHGGPTCVAGGDTGGDTLDYSNGPYDETGVEVNMAGGATAGDSATFFEAAIGSAGKDSFTGNEVSNTLKGRAGNDVFRGGGGDDDIKGAKGNDVMRGGSGDDNLFGGKGKKDKAFGGSGDDFCKGVKQKYRVSCEA